MRRRTGSILILFAVLLGGALSLSACRTLPPVAAGEVPEGFARLKGDPVQTDRWTAVSPEGVKYRIRIVPNTPKQTLDFWSRALENEMLRRGFLSLEEPFTFGAGSGWGVEWVVPYGSADYLFLTALRIYPAYILVCEAAGEAEIFDRYRPVIRESLETMEIRLP